MPEKKVVAKSKTKSKKITKPVKSVKSTKSVKSKKEKTLNNNHDKFLFNAFLFVAIVTVFNFVFYIIDSNHKIVKDNLVQIQSNDSVYSKDNINFNYPKTSNVTGNSSHLNIDNWGIEFYNKSNDYSDFEKWFGDNFDKKDCYIKSMNSDNSTGLSYSLYFLDGINCKNNGLYMVGKKKIGKIVLGVNPNNSYEQVLSSIKF